MAKRIYVGNLPYSVTNDDLCDLFSRFGEVNKGESMVITDKFSGKSKGFGFVEMADDAAADEAIKQLNDSELGGRKLIANEARERTDQPRSATPDAAPVSTPPVNESVAEKVDSEPEPTEA